MSTTMPAPPAPPHHHGVAIQRPSPAGSDGPLNFAQKFHPCHYQIPFFKIKIQGSSSLPRAPAPLPPHAAPGHCQVGHTMQQPPAAAAPPASSAPAPAPQSLVSRARTAIHSAAARVLTDIKADLRGTYTRAVALAVRFPRPNLMSSGRGDRLWWGAQMPKDSAGVAGRRRRGRPWIGRPK